MKLRLAKKILTGKSNLWKKKHKLEEARNKMKGKKGWIILPL